VHLADGRISGGDSFFNYAGSYEVEGDNFSATLTTKRFADGPTTVLGLDEVELKLTGMVKGPIACCAGTSAQAPDLPFEATLILRQEQSRDQTDLRKTAQPEAPSNIARLPRTNSDRYRGRNPFASGPSR
jgi:hypothetical protein